MNLKTGFHLFKDTYQEWTADGATRLGAALAYYTVFSLAPMLIIIISVAGLVLGDKAVRGEVSGDIAGIVGKGSGDMIQSMISHTSQSREGVIGTVIGLVTLFFGAIGLVSQLRDALNIVWDAPKPKPGILTIILSPIFSFVVVLGAGALVIASVVLSAIVGWLGGFLNGIVPGLSIILSVANILISLGLITLLFALIYKVLPNVRIAWSDVWIGALATAVLFTIGKIAIGFYLGHSDVGSAYGAAGSLVVILLWAYYSMQIIFFGAEFTMVYAKELGSRRPAAVPEVVPTGRRRRGIPFLTGAAEGPGLVATARREVAATLNPGFLMAALLSLLIGAAAVFESWLRNERGHAR